jgi:DNA-directed RNA polymerase subunit omega
LSALNSEYVKQALTKVGNPNVLVNLVSRRVRQLTSGGGNSRPLIEQSGSLGAADVSLLELVENKMAFEMMEPEQEAPAPKKRRRS